MKKLLVITTYFPPAPEIGAARIRNIIKYLLELEWEVHVITETNPAYDYAGDDVLRRIHLYSAGIQSAFVSGNKKRSTMQRLVKFIPESIKKQIKSALLVRKYKRWESKAVRKGKEIVDMHRIGTILATLPRIEALCTGSRIKKNSGGIQLVCEYRDIIFDNQIFTSVKSKYENRYTKKAEMKYITYTDKFIFLTEGIKKAYEQLENINTAIRDGIVLTNGYEYEAYQGEQQLSEYEDKLVISHIGHMYGSRNACAFTEAIAELAKEHPDIREKTKILFVGKMDNGARLRMDKICIEHNLKNIIITSPVDHKKATALMAASDLNVIITHTSGSEYALPGKLFEYMGAGRPVLAITTDSLLVKFMKEEKLGWTCQNKPEQIKKCILEIYESWLKGCLPRQINRNSRYDLGNIVKRLDAFLQKGTGT